MPDWLTHSLLGWITGKTIKQEVSLVVVGSLIPDIYKVYPVFDWILKGDTQNFFLPIHTPFGAILITCVIALFFHDIKKALLLLGIGTATHLLLDLFLLNVSGGMLMLFPFSWNGWHLDLIRSDDYMITIYAILAAVAVYSIYFVAEKRKFTQYQVSHATSNIIPKNNAMRTPKKDIFPLVSPTRAKPHLYTADDQINNQVKNREPTPIEYVSLEEKSTTVSEITTMVRSEFEEHLINNYIKLGYKVEKRKQNHERDSHLLLERKGERTIVQIKHSKKPVGTKTVQEVNVARNYYHCQKALVVTNTSFTNEAKQLAERCNVELWKPKNT